MPADNLEFGPKESKPYNSCRIRTALNAVCLSPAALGLLGTRRYRSRFLGRDLPMCFALNEHKESEHEVICPTALLSLFLVIVACVG